MQRRADALTIRHGEKRVDVIQPRIRAVGDDELLEVTRPLLSAAEHAALERDLAQRQAGASGVVRELGRRRGLAAWLVAAMLSVGALGATGDLRAIGELVRQRPPDGRRVVSVGLPTVERVAATPSADPPPPLRPAAHGGGSVAKATTTAPTSPRYRQEKSGAGVIATAHGGAPGSEWSAHASPDPAPDLTSDPESDPEDAPAPDPPAPAPPDPPQPTTPPARPEPRRGPPADRPAVVPEQAADPERGPQPERPELPEQAQPDHPQPGQK